MVVTLRDAGGVGLAANQVGVLRRIIVVQLPEEEEARIYVNPEIVHREGEREVEEGCLSIPSYRGLIIRSLWIRFSALDHSSKVVKLDAEDLLSQVLEHEVDHLNGILYTDHLESHEKLFKVEPLPDAESPDADGQPSDSEQESEAECVESSGMLTAEESDELETPATLKVG